MDPEPRQRWAREGVGSEITDTMDMQVLKIWAVTERRKTGQHLEGNEIFIVSLVVCLSSWARLECLYKPMMRTQLGGSIEIQKREV